MDGFEEKKEKANELFKKKDYNGAISAYLDILKIENLDFYQNSVIYNNISTCLYVLKDFNKALDYAHNALNAFPGFEKAILRKGLCLEQLGGYEEAIMAYSCIFEENYQKEVKEKIENLVKKLDVKDWFKFKVLTEEEKVEFEFDLPSFIEKYLRSILNNTSKSMEDKLTFIIHTNDLEYPITKKSLKIMFKQLFEKRFSASIDEIPPLLALSQFFGLNLLLDQSINVLVGYLDESNSIFFFNWSSKYKTNDTNHPWDILYIEAKYKVKQLFIEYELYLNPEDCQKFSPKDLAVILELDIIYFYNKIIENNLDYLENILIENSEIFTFIEDENISVLPYSMVNKLTRHLTQNDRKEFRIKFQYPSKYCFKKFNIRKIYLQTSLIWENSTLEDLLEIYHFLNLTNSKELAEKCLYLYQKRLINEIELSDNNPYFREKIYLLYSPIDWKISIFEKKLIEEFQDAKSVEDISDELIEKLIKEWKSLKK